MIEPFDALPRADHLARHVDPAYRDSLAAFAGDDEWSDLVAGGRKPRSLTYHARLIREALRLPLAVRGSHQDSDYGNWRWLLAEIAYGDRPCFCEERAA